MRTQTIITLITRKGVALSRSFVIERLSLLRYTSKKFSIVTDWDGGQKYLIKVFGIDGALIEQVECVEYDCADAVFEQLKTKYIFDYSNALC